MSSTLFAIGALVIAFVIGLGRQITVFSAYKPGLWLFRRYKKKRLIGICLVLLLSCISLISGLNKSAIILLIISGALSVIALVFNLEQIFPSLHSVQVKKVQAANAENYNLDSNSQVLVVEIGDECRAYSLEQMVIPRHIIHDTVGGVPIVVTYCALCRTGLVFRSEHNSKRLFFEVVGVFRRNLIMEDNYTYSLWQQATGEGIYGPLSGTCLEMLPSMQIPWIQAKQWTNMTLAIEPENARSAVLATKIGYKLLEITTNLITTPGHTRLSKIIPRREIVFGIQINGKAKAYPMTLVRSSKPFVDVVDGVELDIEFDSRLGSIRVKRRDGEKDPVVEKHWWLGWNEFHPDTEIYNP